MRRSLAFPIVLISILVFAELASYLAIRNFFTEQRNQLRIFNWTWWISTVLLYASVFLSRISDSNFLKNALVNVFMIILVLKLVTGLAFVITILVQFIKSLVIASKLTAAEQLARRKLASQIALGIAAVPFVSLVWGLVKTAYDFKVHRVRINSAKIPAAFQGLKIVQISDIHTGSLQGFRQLQKAVDLINSLKPDLIVFTGDLVNNQSNEAGPYIPILKQLQAPMGIYSVLGNHDYGDYNSWNSTEDKQRNMEEMYQIHRNLNWKLMLNEHVALEKDNEHIALIGIENWSANLNFKKYGKLDRAYQGAENYPYKILLSHDPSHWSYEVKELYKDIDLTLSGHTHGFQFGVEIPGFKWSPSQYIYPQWAGLYKKEDQLLYVNRGLGCLGYMGRIGIRPEITLIELGN
ncbi:MAG: metallophosphoesterase [Crocinitomicaceae bacterium]|jgi:predicted MPP superfamily phosphohydrolase|nr:metallophosphoesterase [Crocinitomicaceae bacterium]